MKIQQANKAIKWRFLKMSLHNKIETPIIEIGILNRARVVKLLKRRANNNPFRRNVHPRNKHTYHGNKCCDKNSLKQDLPEIDRNVFFL